jgi:hypothetical protein
MASAFGGYNYTDAQDKRRQQVPSHSSRSKPKTLTIQQREYGMILLRQAQEREQQKALERQTGTVNTKLTSIQNQLPSFSQNQNPNNPFQLQPPLAQQAQQAQQGDCETPPQLFMSQTRNLVSAPPSRRGRRLRPISGTICRDV